MDHHKDAFNEGTLTKLDIFELYTQEWLPPFIMTPVPTIKDLWIFDFFAGPGYSVSGQPGSPIRILRQIESQADRIIQSGKIIHVRFNEMNKNKVAKLKTALHDYVDNSEPIKKLKEYNLFDGKIWNKDFEALFQKVKPCLGSAPALMFMDQNGIKFISDEYLLPFLNSRLTDFLFFVSSSYFVRFSDRPEFKSNVDFNWQTAKDCPYKFIHREIINFVRGKIPLDSEMRVYPFSIKKGSNIYGLIFGSSHPLGVEKFLRVAWDKNKLNGEANFDIDGDNDKAIRTLFEEFIQPTKIQKFQEDLKDAILAGSIRNNFQAYYYAIEAGFLPDKAAEVVRDLKKAKKLDYSSKTPMISYNSAVKNKQLIEYKLL